MPNIWGLKDRLKKANEMRKDIEIQITREYKKQRKDKYKIDLLKYKIKKITDGMLNTRNKIRILRDKKKRKI